MAAPVVRLDHLALAGDRWDEDLHRGVTLPTSLRGSEYIARSS